MVLWLALLTSNMKVVSSNPSQATSFSIFFPPKWLLSCQVTFLSESGIVNSFYMNIFFFILESIWFMELFVNSVRKRHVRQWVEVQNLNICGKMEPSTKNQRICQHLKYVFFVCFSCRLKADQLLKLVFRPPMSILDLNGVGSAGFNYSGT